MTKERKWENLKLSETESGHVALCPFCMEMGRDGLETLEFCSKEKSYFCPMCGVCGGTDGFRERVKATTRFLHD